MVNPGQPCIPFSALRLGAALVAMLIVYCAASFLLYDKARARGNWFEPFEIL